jgi:SET and MYND domain-containing protein
MRCGTQRYCSEDCEAAAEARHDGVECSALSSLAEGRQRLKAFKDMEDDDIDGITQAVRIVADIFNGVTVDVGSAGTLGAADAYTQRLVGITPGTADAREALRRICAYTLKVLPEAARIPSPQLLDILERHSCNLYGVSGKAGEEVGSASFVGFFHLLNHACCPNVVFDSARPAEIATRTGPCFALRALEHVPKGRELNISYTSSSDPPQERQEHLREHYGFHCGCERCTCDDVSAELDYGDKIDAMRCAWEDCGSGLGVPCVHSTQEDDNDLEQTRRCVHCGRIWECDLEP